MRGLSEAGWNGWPQCWTGSHRAPGGMSAPRKATLSHRPGAGLRYSPLVLLEADEQHDEHDKDQPQGQEEELDLSVIWEAGQGHRELQWAPPGGLCHEVGAGPGAAGPGAAGPLPRPPRPGWLQPSPSAVVTRVRLVPLVPPAAVDAMMCTLYRVDGFSPRMTKELREGFTVAPGGHMGMLVGQNFPPPAQPLRNVLAGSPVRDPYSSLTLSEKDRGAPGISTQHIEMVQSARSVVLWARLTGHMGDAVGPEDGVAGDEAVLHLHWQWLPAQLSL